MKRFSIKSIAAIVLALVLVLATMSVSFAYDRLEYRDRGDAVTAMQRALKNKGYYNGELDGVFKGETLAAVKAFQKAAGLYVDGIAGDITLGALYGGSTPSAPTPAPGNPEDIGKVPTESSTLHYTSTGTKVSTLQKALKKLGYYDGAIDGTFGEGTLKAVRAFQRASGLHADGLVGEQTAKKLNEKQSTYTLTLGSTISEGGIGQDVKQIQDKLQKLGFYKGGDAYGEFGTNTIKAVNAFQAAIGATQTGYVTASTYAAIMAHDGDFTNYVTMRKGSSGASVSALNLQLRALGYNAPTGDQYDEDTVAAVKKFQRTYNLDVDGVAGPKTQKKLNSLK